MKLSVQDTIRLSRAIDMLLAFYMTTDDGTQKNLDDELAIGIQHLFNLKDELSITVFNQISEPKTETDIIEISMMNEVNN